MRKAAQSRGFALFDDPGRPMLVDASGNPDFALIQQSADFQLLRRRLLRFIFPMSALFLGWYLTFVLLSAYAHDFVSTRVFGVVNVGILFGLCQFLSTIAITLAYTRYAKRRLDPQTQVLRDLAGVEEAG
jgi:uncharacterized membrane protein (DUF485 family)